MSGAIPARSAPVRDRDEGSLPALNDLLGLGSPLQQTFMEQALELAPEDELGEPHPIVIHKASRDVNGDGFTEILESFIDLREAHPTDGFRGTLHVRTLDGRTGKVRGHFTERFSGGVPAPFVAKVGRGGDIGLMIATIEFVSSQNNPTYSLRLTAVDASSEQRWTREFTSTWTSTPQRFVGATGVAVPRGLHDSIRGDATDVLLSITDYAGPAVRTTPALVDGRDGSVKELEPLMQVNTSPALTAIDDVDGDRRDDILVIGSGDGSTIAALEARSGSELWQTTRPSPADVVSVTPVPDATGDRIADIALASPFHILDGSSGRVVRKGGPTALVDVIEGPRDRRLLTQQWRIRRHRLEGKLELYDAKAREDRTRLFRPALPKLKGWAAYVYTALASDVSADATPDLFLQTGAFSQEGRERESRAILDSRTLRTIVSGSDLYPLDRTIGTRGPRFLRINGKTTRRVRAIAGDRSWTAAVSVPAKEEVVLSSYPVAAKLGPDEAADAVVTFQSRKGAHAIAFDGLTGDILWKRRVHKTGS